MKLNQENNTDDDEVSGLYQVKDVYVIKQVQFNQQGVQFIKMINPEFVILSWTC